MTCSIQSTALPSSDSAIADMGHRRIRRRAVPVFFAGRKPDDIARTNFLDWAALALRPAATQTHDERLAERMRVPCGPRARLESDNGSADASGGISFERRVDPDGAREIVCLSLCRRL